MHEIEVPVLLQGDEHPEWNPEYGAVWDHEIHGVSPDAYEAVLRAMQVCPVECIEEIG